MLIFGQNSDQTNFDLLLKKFHEQIDATIHTNEIAQHRQITNVRTYLQIPLPLPEFSPIGQWNRFK